MKNLEIRTVNPAWVCTCSVCNVDYRTTGNSYYDTTDGLLVCNDCAEGGSKPIYAIENVHYVGVSDKRDIVVFDGAEEVRISQRSILNHKKLVAFLHTIEERFTTENGSWLEHKINQLLEEENDETV